MMKAYIPIMLPRLAEGSDKSLSQSIGVVATNGSQSWDVIVVQVNARVNEVLSCLLDALLVGLKIMKFNNLVEEM